MPSTQSEQVTIPPVGWIELRFEQFATLKRGEDLTRGQFKDGVVPVAGSNGVIGFHDQANVRGPGVTVGRSGSVGKVRFYESDFWAHNTALFVSDFHGNDSRFVGYFLGFLNLSQFRSGVSVPTLDRNAFKSYPVIVPPRSEQRSIAAFLRAVECAIEQQERLLALTGELKQALAAKLLTVGMRGESRVDSALGPVPASWRVLALGDAISDSPKNGLYRSADAYGSGTPILRINDFSNDGDMITGAAHRVRIDDVERAAYALRENDIVVNRVNSLSHLGKTALIGPIPEPMVFESNMMRFRVDEPL